MDNKRGLRYKNIKAVEFFAGREDYKKVFWDEYQKNQNHVLAFYGFGGVGKSGLLGELAIQIEEKIEKPLYVYYDFDEAQDQRSVLESIKRDLAREFGFTFPLFDLALLTYAGKIGEDISNDGVKSFIEENGIADLVLSWMEVIPVVGSIAQTVGLFDKTQVIARKLIKNAKIKANPELNSALQQMHAMEAKEIYERLLEYFIKDLNDNLKDEQRSLIVLLDTYEQLVNEMSTLGEPLENDLWIRGDDGLIKNIPNALWVIAGRQKLKWEILDSDWESGITQSRVKELDLVDTLWFLAQYQITDRILGEEIHKLTGGTPVYLDLCVEQYKKIEAKGKKPKIDDFGKNIHSLLERYTRYLEDEQKDILYVLACLEKWNDDIVYTIAKEVLPSFSPIRYENVKKFSIIEAYNDKNYKIQRSVANIIAQQCPEYIKGKVLQTALAYYEEKIKCANKFTNEYGKCAEKWMICACKCFENQKELMEYYADYLENIIYELMNLGKLETAYNIFAPLWDVAVQKKGTALYQSALNTHGCICARKGNYEKASEYLRESGELAIKLYGTRNIVLCTVLNNMAAEEMDLGLYEMALEKFKVIHSDLVEIEGGVETKNSLSALSSIGNTLMLLQRYDEASEVLLDAHLAKKKVFGEYARETLKSVCDYYGCLARMNASVELLEGVNWLYEKQKSLFGESDLDTIHTLTLKLEMSMQLEQYEKALDIAEEAYRQFAKIYGERHFHTISMISAKAEINRCMGNYEMALSILKEVNKETDGWEIGRSEVWQSRLSEADIYADMGEVEIAFQKYQELLNKLTEYHLSESHPNVLSVIKQIASRYKDIGKTEDSIVWYERALTVGTEIWGPENRNLAPILDSLMDVTYNQDNMKEYLEYGKQLYAIYEAYQQEEKEEALKVLGKIVEQSHELGQSEAGYEYAKKLDAYYQNGESKVMDADTLVNHAIDMAHVFEDVGEYEVALGYVRTGKNCIELPEENFDGNLDDENYRNYLCYRAFVYRHCAEIFEQCGEIQEAVEILQKAHEELSLIPIGQEEKITELKVLIEELQQKNK